MPEPALPEPPLRLLAAGSLRRALSDHVDATGHHAFDLVFGPAGALRRRIEAGAPCDLFLSANMEHPIALAARMPGATVMRFARNSLVAVARPGVGLRTDNFLERLLDPAVRLGTSTPGADPGGDYAVALFRKARAIREDAEGILLAKAKHLVGGWQSPAGSPGVHPIRHALAEGTVEVFLCYRTTALDIANDFDVVAPPAALAVSAEYAALVTARQPGRRLAASAFAETLLSGSAQACFRRYGFGDPLDPRES